MMTLEEAFFDARATFPNFPEAVFLLWLDERIRGNGWPPEGIEWEGFLCGKPIPYWRKLRWHKQALTLNLEQLTGNSIQLTNNLLLAATGERNLVSAYIPNTVERFKSCLRYLQENGTTPGELLLLQDEKGISVIEGNHRVAALIAYQSLLPSDYPKIFVDAWVAMEEITSQ